MKRFFLYSFVIFAFISDHNSTLVCRPPPAKKTSVNAWVASDPAVPVRLIVKLPIISKACYITPFMNNQEMLR